MTLILEQQTNGCDVSYEMLPQEDTSAMDAIVDLMARRGRTLSDKYGPYIGPTDRHTETICIMPSDTINILIYRDDFENDGDDAIPQLTIQIIFDPAMNAMTFVGKRTREEIIKGPLDRLYDDIFGSSAYHMDQLTEYLSTLPETASYTTDGNREAGEYTGVTWLFTGDNNNELDRADWQVLSPGVILFEPVARTGEIDEEKVE